MTCISTYSTIYTNKSFQNFSKGAAEIAPIWSCPYLAVLVSKQSETAVLTCFCMRDTGSWGRELQLLFFPRDICNGTIEGISCIPPKMDPLQNCRHHTVGNCAHKYNIVWHWHEEYYTPQVSVRFELVRPAFHDRQSAHRIGMKYLLQNLTDATHLQFFLISVVHSMQPESVALLCSTSPQTLCQLSVRRVFFTPFSMPFVGVSADFHHVICYGIHADVVPTAHFWFHHLIKT